MRRHLAALVSKIKMDRRPLDIKGRNLSNLGTTRETLMVMIGLKMLSNPGTTRRIQDRPVKFVETCTMVNTDSKESLSVTIVGDSIILLEIAKVNQFNKFKLHRELKRKPQCSLTAIIKIEHVWYIDNECSNQMTSHKPMLINMDRSVSTIIKMGNGQIVQACGKMNLGD